MNYSEESTWFCCSGESLLGILARPQTPRATGVVVVVGGPQYRAGSHRQFVLLARTLAAAGIAVLRFDCRGMGDSEGEPRDFQRVGADIGAAIDALQQRLPCVKQVTLWGLCDGASAALLYCGQRQDPRVTGLCLLNPWVRSEASLARTQVRHYYTQRVTQKEFWLKLLKGQVGLGAVGGLAQGIRLAASGGARPTSKEPAFQQRMAAAWDRFPGQILLLLSGEDYVAKEFLDCLRTDAAWTNALGRANVLRRDVPGADHTFSGAASRQLAEQLTLDWLTQHSASTRAAIDRADLPHGLSAL